MYSKKYHLLLVPLVCILVLCAMFLGFSLYQNSLQKNLNQTAFQTLEELLEQQKFNFNERVDADMNSIKNLASFSCFLPGSADVAKNLGAALVQNTNFDYIVLSDKNGTAISSNGLSLNLQNRSFFQAALSGETLLSAPRFSSVNNNLVLPLATPIYHGDQVVGVLAAAYNLSNLEDLLLPAYGGRAFAVITDGQGSVIYSPNNQSLVLYQQNLFDSISEARFLQYDNWDDIVTNTKKHLGGHSLFSLAGNKLMMQYAPLDINDWYIFMVAPESVVASQADSILEDSALLTVSVLIIFSLLTVYTLWLQRKVSSEKLARLAELETVAYYDSLTKLPNLSKFKLDGEALLRAHPDCRYFILKFDIHNFKIINELFGFNLGNKVICSIAEFMLKAGQARNISGTLARITADEFIVLADANQIDLIVNESFQEFDDKLHEALSHILGTHRIECRYGRYLLEPTESDLTAVIEKVNLAHRVAKRDKYKGVCNFDQSFKEIALREAQIENQMEYALEQEEFIVYLQPKYHLGMETVIGSEALVRWHESGCTILSPIDFIPLFEQNGFILKLDMYVLEKVCQLLRLCIQENRPLLPISVNFSRLHLTNPNFVSELSNLTDKYQVPKEYIEIELTESIIFNNEEALDRLLFELHKVGFTLSMDDFGTGYSSLGLLKNLPVDVLKIDKMFFSDNLYKERGKLVLESIMQMAKKLNICIVAEGVEIKEDIDFLRAVGCDIVQGYYFSKPIPASDFIHKYARPSALPSKRA